MSTIKILPEILSNKIAAGEVVERPASVVKELVENALDAKSTRIIIEIEKGGRSLIRVSDNGIGMNHDDALLSLERYATSKIYKENDLFEIRTLGFRGEALPSIASVSRCIIITKDGTSAPGTEIVVEGGKIIKVSEAGAPTGTMITVKQLFFNTPARRKFLKTINMEMGHIVDSVSRIALSRPDVQFRLLHNNKTIKNWSITTDPTVRIADVLGKDLRNELHRMESTSDAVSITGWISSPRITRSTSRSIHIYVNGRFVTDRIIQHALFEGYQGRLMKGKYPIAILFLTVPFDEVDVNVHPTKHEVRFSEQKKIHDSIADVVSNILRQKDRPNWAASKIDKRETPRVADTLFSYRRSEETPTVTTKREESNDSPSRRMTQETLWEDRFFTDLRVIGQFRNTYIVCESDDAIVLVDQHAAHERVLYEQFQQRSETTETASQARLLPETIELGYREADTLNRLIPELSTLGLEIEHFGGNTFVVKAVPQLLADRDITALVIEIVETIISTGFGSELKRVIDHILTVMACHGAIRANQALSDKQMQALLSQLDKCTNPSQCPHGRPTWIQWTTGNLEISFKRIV